MGLYAGHGQNHSYRYLKGITRQMFILMGVFATHIVFIYRNVAYKLHQQRLSTRMDVILATLVVVSVLEVVVATMIVVLPSLWWIMKLLSQKLLDVLRGVMNVRCNKRMGSQDNNN